jgi:hypothetical protein
MQRQERNVRQAPSDEYLLGQPGPKSKKRRLNNDDQQQVGMHIVTRSLDCTRSYTPTHSISFSLSIIHHYQFVTCFSQIDVFVFFVFFSSSFE